MTDILEKICADKGAHIARQKQLVSFGELEARIATPVRPFAENLAAKSKDGFGVIAEMKRGSPSGGLIRENFAPAEIARAYAAGGAACLSVLTDTPWFRGRDDDLMAARAACTLPVLRKDFMLDVYQIAESRALGADCILLILACLSDNQAGELAAAAAHHYGMAVLAEVHDEAELTRALALPAPFLLGINNRNLKTLETDLAVSERLTALVPAGVPVISESGIRGNQDMKRLKQSGIHRFLVGESLLRQENLELALKNLMTV